MPVPASFHRTSSAQQCPAPPPPRGHRPGAPSASFFPSASTLSRRGKPLPGTQRGLTPSRSDIRAGEPLSSRQGALTAARAGAPRHPPRVADPLRPPAPGRSRPTPRRTAKLPGRGAGRVRRRGGGRGQLRSRGGGESARPCPPPAKPKRAPALTSCSEQRKISVQRPVQQPMVATGEPPPLLRFFPPALTRPRRRGGGLTASRRSGRACVCPPPPAASLLCGGASLRRREVARGGRRGPRDGSRRQRRALPGSGSGEGAGGGRSRTGAGWAEGTRAGRRGARVGVRGRAGAGRRELCEV